MPAETQAAYAPPKLSLADLRRVHPLWLRHRAEWLDTKAVTSGALRNKETLADYVPKAEREHAQDYRARLGMTRFVPECTVARQRIVGALFSQRPARELKSEVLKEWIGRVTRAGLSIQALEEESVVPTALDYGAAHVLIDRPQGNGQKLESQADLKAAGLFEPHAAVYTPLEVRNWQLAPDGTLEWVLIVEQSSEPNGLAGARVLTRTYRWFDRKGWCIWKTRPAEGRAFPPERWDTETGEAQDIDAKAGKAREQVFSGPTFDTHGAAQLDEGRGRVPLASLIPDPIEELIGRSAISNAVQLDLKRAILESDLMWDLYVHAHPYLVIETDRELSQVGVGSNTALKLNPDQKEKAYYLTVPSESFQARERALSEAKADTHRHTGADPMSTMNAPGEASGVARAWSFTTSEGRHLGRIADRVEAFELTVLTLVAGYTNEQPPKSSDVRWPDKFESDSASAMVEQGIAFPQAVKSPTAQKLFQKRIARSTLGDVSPEDLTKIDAEIDAAETSSAVVAALGG